jgi:hypothetical protein
MPGLAPGIDVLNAAASSKTWMAGPTPAEGSLDAAMAEIAKQSSAAPPLWIAG